MKLCCAQANCSSLMVHVYPSLYILRCMMLIIGRLCLIVPFSYRSLLQLETWHSVSLPDEVGEIAIYGHSSAGAGVATPYNHQLACGLSPPACRCGTSLPWAIGSSSLVGQCITSELSAFDNIMN